MDAVNVRGVYSPDLEVRRQTVSYADLDLRREAGVRTLLARIRVAARNVCEPQPSIHELRDQAQYRVCMYDAISGAVYHVHNPRVAELFDNQG